MSLATHRPIDLTLLDRKVAERILGARARSTWERYDQALVRLRDWAESQGISISVPIAPTVVAAWISHLADEGLSSSTIRISAAAVSALHAVSGEDSPCRHPQVQQLLRGATREMRANRGAREADPLLPEHLREILDEAMRPDGWYRNRETMLLRDSAILLFGWAGGFRRGEIAGLSVDQLAFDEDSIIVRLEHHKRSDGTPHERRIVRSPTDLCPVHALEQWTEVAGIDDGKVFRRVYRGEVSQVGLSGSSIDSVVRRLCRTLPKPKGRQPRFSSHSLRAGIATTAALAGRPDRDIADHLGHRSIATTARYVRTARVRKSELTRGLI